MSVFAIELCHSSDHNCDGVWYTLERTTDRQAARRLLAKYSGPRAYHGRPLRIMEFEGKST